MTRNRYKCKYPNTYTIRDGYFEISLSLGKVSLIDFSDFDLVKDYQWCAAKCGKFYYAVSREKDNWHKRLYMHRLILGSPTQKDVDHINHNTLDNRRINLRVATRSENLQNHGGALGRNKLGVLGISRKNSGFMVRINSQYLGIYSTLAEAIDVRRQAELHYFGEFAPRKEILHEQGSN